MRINVFVVGMFACVASVTLSSQGASPTAPTKPTEADARLFQTYCASCHGPNAQGNGPVAELLRKPPPDLTKYAARNGGVFPAERIRQIVDGRGIASHGNREMPVWGDAFRTGPGGLSPEAVKARIDAIVRYLGAIQERTAE